uniref:LYR motif containing 7 n=1 Tax=Fundulus heteroclitus TaxID=8078 RepID=A0A3Q2PXG5_FUNHE
MWTQIQKLTRVEMSRVFINKRKTRRTYRENTGRAGRGNQRKFVSLSYSFLFYAVFLNVQMIKMGSDVETVLREAVLQVEHVEENKLLLRPREGLLLENVPYCDEPRKNS